MSEKIIITQQLKEENEKLNVNENENKNVNENEDENENENENEDENKKFKKNKTVTDANIKELIGEPKEIKSPNRLDKNTFKEILTIIDSNKFGHKNKIGDFKYIDIKDLFNNIKDNTISEKDAKKYLDTLNIIKNSEIKHKRLIPGQKELLNLFNDLADIILTDKTLDSESQEDENKNENEKDENEKLKEEKEKKNENENEKLKK